MGHAHSHSHRHEPGHADRRGRGLLAASLIPLALATVVGLVLLWPAHRHYPVPVQFQAVGGRAVVFVPGTVTAATTAACRTDPAQRCAEATVRLDDGPEFGTTTTLAFGAGPGSPRLAVGDRVRLARTADPATGAVNYLYDDVLRGTPLGVLAGVFAVVVVLVARWRGLAALAGLGVAYAVLAFFLLPALLAGESPVAVALTAAAAILFVVLYLAHGPSARTSTALLGTLASLGLTGALAVAVTATAKLTGLSSDVVTAVQTSAPAVSVSGLVLCGVVIGALGVLNDVTVTQASAVWELHEVDPAAPRRRVYRAAMRIGRDHIASSVYTLVLAYAGSSIPLLLLVSLSGRSVSDIVTGDEIAEELVRGLVGGVGLVAAVPITTAVAVYVVGRQRTATTRAEYLPAHGPPL
jgi:uncharacterized membrane protein